MDLHAILSSPWLYPAALALISLLTIGLEYAFKLRTDQKQLRPMLWSDVLHLVFNGHFLGVIIYGIASHRLMPLLDRVLGGSGWTEAVYRNVASEWPVWLQIIVALVAIDFLQWSVHNLLHRVSFLWDFHKTHHSVVDGEMDWIVSFRFQWTEVVVYRAVLFVPLAWFGFGLEAVMFHAIFGTLIGHLNHANLDWDYGPLRYVFNSPRMHLWHHDYDGDERTTVNFGIIFSTWDWIFGTASMPDHPPARIGFAGVETFPQDFMSQMAWPLGRWIPESQGMRGVTMGAGCALLLTGWVLAQPPQQRVETPMMGEVAATSQPSAPRQGFDYAASAEEADAKRSAFGDAATEAGFARPDLMVSADELARALQSDRLVLLDVRPLERFTAGHIPSAQPLDRPDYSHSDPVPGLSRPGAELEALLRARGANDGDTIVAYGDGGPEPYRLWWTLRAMTGLEIRVLDGGMAAWMQSGHALAAGEPATVAEGTLSAPRLLSRSPALYADAVSFLETHPDAVLLDTRSAEEFLGEDQHKKAARAGRMPGAQHVEWWSVWRDGLDDQRLRPPAELRAQLAAVGVSPSSTVMTMCQSGTRSSAVYFALLQSGHDASRLLNYDGSWAEYSRVADAPVALGR